MPQAVRRYGRPLVRVQQSCALLRPVDDPRDRCGRERAPALTGPDEAVSAGACVNQRLLEPVAESRREVARYGCDVRTAALRDVLQTRAAGALPDAARDGDAATREIDLGGEHIRAIAQRRRPGA